MKSQSFCCFNWDKKKILSLKESQFFNLNILSNAQSPQDKEFDREEIINKNRFKTFCNTLLLTI